MPVWEALAAVSKTIESAATETAKKSFETVKPISEIGIRKLEQNPVEDIKHVGDVVLGKMNAITHLTPEQLIEKMEQNLSQRQTENGSTINESQDAKEGLTVAQKAKIEKETGWSKEIINAIRSMKEYEIYKDAGLDEAEIGGKKCLIRSEIDWEQKDAMGRTNKERAEQGLSPINKDGKIIELHHIGQHADSPLAELTVEEHRGKGNDAILHDKTKESEIDRPDFAGERSAHWEARANERGNQA